MRRFFAGRYRDALAKRAAEGTLRSTTVRTETLIDFASNDYLGVARDSSFAAAHFAAEARRADAAAGSTGSRLSRAHHGTRRVRTRCSIHGRKRGSSAGLPANSAAATLPCR